MLIVGVQACCFLAAEFRRWCSFAILDFCVGRILLAGSWVGFVVDVLLVWVSWGLVCWGWVFGQLC